MFVRGNDKIELPAARLHEIAGTGHDPFLAERSDRLAGLAADTLKYPAINQHLEGARANGVFHEEEVAEQPAIHPDRHRTAG